jgi:hypothetical protein
VIKVLATSLAPPSALGSLGAYSFKISKRAPIRGAEAPGVGITVALAKVIAPKGEFDGFRGTRLTVLGAKPGCCHGRGRQLGSVML